MTLTNRLASLLVLLVALAPGLPVQAAEEPAASHLAAYSLPAAPVGLRASALVETPLVRLGDLFDGLGEIGATPVARAPAPGARVTLDARWLQALARRYGVAWQPRSALDNVVVERASRMIERPRIEAFLEGVLADHGPAGDLEMIFDTRDLTMVLPSDAEDSLRLFAAEVLPALHELETSPMELVAAP